MTIAQREGPEAHPVLATVRQAVRAELDHLALLKAERLLTIQEAATMAGLSLSSAYRDPDFPKPVKVGRPGRNGQVRCSRYPLSEVQAYIARRIAARDAEGVQQ